jgi:hypothetical protein
MDLFTLLLPVTAIGVHDPLAACASSSFQHLQPGPVLVLTPHGSSSLASELLQRLHISGHWTVLISSEDGVVKEASEKPSNIVFLPLSNLTKLRTSLGVMAAWNSRARFLILTSDKDMSHFILSTFRELNAVNAVILELAPNSPNVRAYTWFPYLPAGQCGEQELKPILSDECLKESNAVSFRNMTLFPQKVPFDLNGCPIIVSTFPWPPFIINPQPNNKSEETFYTEGLEIKLMSVIAQSLNSTIEYLPPPANESKWGGRTASGTWNGILGDLFYKRADVAFASMTATEERNQFLETTVRYWSNSVVWVIPRPGFVSGWRSLLGIFKPTLWGIAAMAYLLGSASLCTLGRTVRRPSEPALYRNPGSCMMATWALSLETGAHRQPRGLIMRLVFICWVIYCLQISTAYKSSLISFLTNPRPEPAILDMKQLVESHLSFEYTVGLSEYFDDPADASMRRIRDSLHFCLNITACLNKAAAADSALVSDKWYVEYLIPQLYLDCSGEPLLQTLPEEVLSYHVVMVLSKGNVLLERFNYLISRVVESGLSEKWAKDLGRKRKLRAMFQDGAGERRLSIFHLQSVFVFLLLGESVALLSLIIEVMMPKEY